MESHSPEQVYQNLGFLPVEHQGQKTTLFHLPGSSFYVENDKEGNTRFFTDQLIDTTLTEIRGIVLSHGYTGYRIAVAGKNVEGGISITMEDLPISERAFFLLDQPKYNDGQGRENTYKPTADLMKEVIREFPTVEEQIAFMTEDKEDVSIVKTDVSGMYRGTITNYVINPPKTYEVIILIDDAGIKHVLKTVNFKGVYPNRIRSVISREQVPWIEVVEKREGKPDFKFKFRDPHVPVKPFLLSCIIENNI